MMKFFVVAALLTLLGCAPTKRDVLRVGDGKYDFTQHLKVSNIPLEELKEIVLSEANIYCINHGKNLRVLSVRKIPSPLRGKRSEIEVLFSCQ